MAHDLSGPGQRERVAEAEGRDTGAIPVASTTPDRPPGSPDHFSHSYCFNNTLLARIPATAAAGPVIPRDEGYWRVRGSRARASRCPRPGRVVPVPGGRRPPLPAARAAGPRRTPRAATRTAVLPRPCGPRPGWARLGMLRRGRDTAPCPPRHTPRNSVCRSRASRAAQASAATEAAEPSTPTTICRPAGIPLPASGRNAG